MMICGNKSDLTNERCVSQETGSEFAKNKEVLFIETSALDSTNVSKAFLTIV
jgi:GTPase SAR1 family protein